MATSYTSLLSFALPATGELPGTWGAVVNTAVTQLVEDSVAGVATASVAAGNWTLSTTTGATNEARKAILIPTGSPGVSRNIIAPSQSKAYVVINQSDAAVVLKGAATTGVTIATGAKALCAWNGTDFVQVDVDLSNVTGTLAVTHGGTGRATSTTAYALLAAGTTATGVHQTLAAGATTEVLVGGGAAALPAWTTATGSGAPVRATSPTLVTPDLGTPSAVVLTNATGTAASLTVGAATNATLATAANGLKSATTTVSVSGATAPVLGQVLTATSDSAATWQTPTTPNVFGQAIVASMVFGG